MSPDADAGETLSVRCAPARIADVVGQKRSNILRLVREHGVLIDRVQEDSRLGHFDIVVEGSSGIRRGCIIKDLCYSVENYHSETLDRNQKKENFHA